VVAAVVPISLGFASVTLAIGTVAIVGRAFEFSTTVTSFISMIGFAVGID
jgi:uncharacterized membrane protein YdfJ with MMPL/SSD domain